MHLIRRAAPLTAILVLVAILAACTATDPRLEDEPAPPTTAPTALTTPTPISAAHVALTVATANAVTVDVTDDSSSLVSAASGAPGDGSSVEAYTLAVTNVSPTTLRLTWVGGPCDSANQLSIDADRSRLVLIQPECPGDSIATDRILDLEFDTPVKASDVEAFLQDGIDS